MAGPAPISLVYSRGDRAKTAPTRSRSCPRCGGLLVTEQFVGETSPLGGWKYDGVRCVNCGAVFYDKR